MDSETAEVVERINVRIDVLEASLRAEIRRESTAIRDDLRVEMSSMRGELRTDIRDSLEESKRHAQVLHESVRDDIRMLADGFAVISTKLDSLQR